MTEETLAARRRQARPRIRRLLSNADAAGIGSGSRPRVRPQHPLVDRAARPGRDRPKTEPAPKAGGPTRGQIMRRAVLVAGRARPGHRLGKKRGPDAGAAERWVGAGQEEIDAP